MSAVSRSSMSPSSSGSSVSLFHLSSAFVVYDLQTRDSGLGLFAKAQNILIHGGTFVSHSRRLLIPSVFKLDIFTRSAAVTMSIVTKVG